MLHGHGQAPLQNELLIEHLNGAVAGDNGLDRVGGRRRSVEHAYVGEHPFHIGAFFEVASLAQDTKLKLRIRDREWVHHADRNRSTATYVAHLGKAAVATCNQFVLAVRSQGHIVETVAHSFDAAHRHAIAVRSCLDQTSRFRGWLVG